MITVNLCAVFLNVFSDPSELMSVDRVPKLQPAPSKDVTVRTLANGRERMVTRAGSRWSVSLTFGYCTRTQVEWIEAHAGVLLTYRDHRGRKFHGVFSEPQIDETAWITDHADVSLTFREVTASEAV